MEELIALDDKYGEEQDGILVQITDVQSATNTKTSNIQYPGMYSYRADKDKWLLVNTEAWMSFDSAEPAINGDLGRPVSEIITYTYPPGSAFEGQQFQFNANDLKDLFGKYDGFTQINHHFGTCTEGNNSDFAGEATCDGHWSHSSNRWRWRTHRINEILDNNGNGTGDYHGRIQQVWIK